MSIRSADDLTRLSAALPSLVALLILPAAVPKSDLVGLLRGRVGVEAELREARAIGYYEGLLDTPGGCGRPRRPACHESAATPPPGWVSFENSGVVRAEPTYLRWRLRPNLDVRWNGKSFRTNRLGYRGPEIEPTKPGGTYRIAVFGSSNTMGHGVDDDETYVRHLERWLNERAGPSRRVEVVNLAISADSPTRRLRRMQEEAGRLEADWILCDASVLDFSLEVMHLRAVVGERLPIPFPFVDEVVRRAGIAPGDTIADVERKLGPEFEALLDGAYAGWGAEARRRGTRLAVLILPRADDKVESPYLHQLIRSLIRRHGLEGLDVADAFDDLPVEQFRVAPWDRHPSPEGHRAIFESIKEDLLRQGGLPGLPFPPA